MDGTWVVWTSAVVSAIGAVGAIAALGVTMGEGRAVRRNTEFLAHRDQWWKRWSWVADDHWMFLALHEHADHAPGREDDDDLGDV